MMKKEKIKRSKNMKTKMFFGFLCMFIGLSFSLIYQLVLNLDSLLCIIPVCLGFSIGNFIIILGIIEEIDLGEKNDANND